MLRRALSRLLHSTLDAAGYWVRKREVLPFGIDYMLDIQRLSATLDISINVFFDVGANVGQTAKAALSSFPAARVFSFEPDPSAFAELQKLRSNRLSTHSLALSDKAGAAQFFSYGSSSTMNSLIGNSHFALYSDLPARTISVQCDTTDAFCQQHDITSIDILKIDTEGTEISVLRGSKRMLDARKIRFVYAEFSGMVTEEGATGGALIPIAEILCRHGFRFVASYTENMDTTKDLFVNSNALFVLPTRP